MTPEGATKMSRRRQWKGRTAGLVAAVVLAGGAALAQQGAASTRADGPRVAAASGLCRPLNGYFFGQNLVRADIALVVNGSLHLVRIDRGRVKSVAADSIDLRERDGSVVTLPVAVTATVRVNGRPATILSLKRRHVALTVRDGDNPASCVQAFTSKS
jgi:hypothetical protein